MAKERSVTGARRRRRSSPHLLRWSGPGAVLAGVLFAAWGYLHKGSAPQPPDAIASALGLVVPLLFLLGLAGFYVRSRGRTGWWLGWLGFIFGFIGSGLGVAYRLMEISGIVTTADRYGYVVGKGWPPQLFDWFPWLLVGLTLMSMATVRAGSLRGLALLPLAMGIFGWAYYLSDFESTVQMRAVHVLFGVLFSLSWVFLGYLLWSEGTGRHTGAPRR
jgi:hypothetical protein